MRNLRLAFRTLVRTPFVTTIAVLSLALGIGANAAIYSAFNQMLLAPLPVQQPGELVSLGAPGPKPGMQNCGMAGDCDVVFSYPMFRDLEQAQTSFTGIAAHWLNDVNVAYGEHTSNTRAVFVSGSYFPVLGIVPAMGRLLSPIDDHDIGSSPVAVLGYDYWTTQLGGDTRVLNTVIRVNGQPLTIVGVAPRGFGGTTLGVVPAVYIPITMREVLYPLFKRFTERRSYWLYLFARLKPGVTIQQAQAAINGPYHSIINDVEAPIQKEMSAPTLVKFRAKQITIEDGSRGQSGVRADAKPALILLFVTTGIVLLIACANIANLLLARAANRSSELAIRLSLGATRGQLLAQLLTESFVLAALGGVVSLIVARWTLGLITQMMPGDAAAALHLTLRASAIWFTGALALGTGLLFGLFPALHSTRLDLDQVLRTGSGKLAGGREASRFRSALVTAQIALSMALLISAGLFVRSLRNVSRVDLGLRADSVVMFSVSPSLNGYTPGRTTRLFADLSDALRSLPGVRDVSAGVVALVAGNNWGNSVSVQGFAKGPDIDNGSRFNAIGPGYFRTLGIPMIAGREFTESDIVGAPRVAVVNEAFAKKFNLGGDAVGKFMGTGDSLTIEIVGLVKDSKYSQVKLPVPPVFFLPYRQDTTYGGLTFYVRASTDVQAMLRAIPGVVRHVDPTLPVEDLKTVPEQVRENVFLDRMLGTLAFGFAALATLLAAVGLYGVLAYSVAQRTREIGVRMALGADSARIGLMVLRQVGLMTLVGAPIGIAGAIALGKGARSILFGLDGTDPIAIAGAAGILALVALGAGYLPARRASKVDPVQAIRYE
ncbi:MAG: ABC transporter permease [Gemmatimonadales bacterium]